MNIIESIHNLEIMKNIELGMLERAKGKYEELEAMHLEKGSNLTDIIVDGGSKKDDVVDFIYKTREEVYIKDMSLYDYINHLEDNIKFYNENISDYYTVLKDLKGIEYRLYSLIKYEGLSPTKAVEKVARETNKDITNIWKYHYKKIKKYIKDY